MAGSIEQEPHIKKRIRRVHINPDNAFGFYGFLMRDYEEIAVGSPLSYRWTLAIGRVLEGSLTLVATMVEHDGKTYCLALSASERLATAGTGTFLWCSMAGLSNWNNLPPLLLIELAAVDDGAGIDGSDHLPMTELSNGGAQPSSLATALSGIGDTLLRDHIDYHLQIAREEEPCPWSAFAYCPVERMLDRLVQAGAVIWEGETNAPLPLSGDFVYFEFGPTCHCSNLKAAVEGILAHMPLGGAKPMGTADARA